MNEKTDTKPTIAIIGGSGNLGTGLARRWAKAGYQINIGSRTLEKAQEAAAACHEYLSDTEDKNVQAFENLEAAKSADIVAMTVPFSHHRSTLEYLKPVLAGKVLIDVTVPLVPPKVARVQLPEGGSAGQIAQDILGEDVFVVSAFQNVAAHHLQEGHGLECDVLVSGNSKEAREKVIELIEAIGMRGLHAGRINNAAAAEALTSVLINLNRQFKTHAGIHITGLD